MTEVHQFLTEIADRALPRILTQISRDPGAPFYGACDRNWWHYKIRDFPSIILQQAGYAISIAADLPLGCANAAQLLDLAASSACFWNQRAILHGAFEEYYPYEQGYPPVAFSTLAAAKLCHQGIVPIEDIRSGLAIAAKQLLIRFEAEAANQQIAGTAALSVIRSLDPSLVDESSFQKILTKILALQNSEGWFPEYDGPDLGYLTVSIDCLWDIFDHTGDIRVREAIITAADYTAWFALNPLGAAGMHNSRNTDYFVPYGLVRLALEDSISSAQTVAVVQRLFTRKSPEAFHPFDAIDDRYWCHYIGHSILRALQLLENEPKYPHSENPLSTPIPSQKPSSGHALIGSSKNAIALISTRKGAITSALWPDGSSANDFGWIVQTSGKLFVTHWWNTAWKVSFNDNQASCEGYLVSHKEHLSAPWKHIVLRIGSFCMGRRLIRILKRLVIFKKPQQILHFTRSVIWENEILVIRDTITGVTENDTITRAPRQSKRHVASADSFHTEDFQMLVKVARSEKTSRDAGCFECETTYERPGI
jgi:hypothetical protein